MLLGGESVDGPPSQFPCAWREVWVADRDEFQLANRPVFIDELLWSQPNAPKEVPVGGLRLAAVPGQQLGEQPSRPLFARAFGGISRDAGSQLVGNFCHLGCSLRQA